MPPLSIMIKPASGLCNLHCSYCFYADESANRERASYGIMSVESLEQIIKRVLAHAEGNCTIAFQGGEPTLAGLDFFRKVMELQRKWNINHVKISSAIQTNGILIAREWASFFREYNFLVSISLDGNRRVHDANRLDDNGNGSFDRVIKSMDLLKEYGVEFNVLSVVTRQTVSQVRNIYQFFSRAGAEYQQYIPCLDPLNRQPGGESYSLNEELYEKCESRVEFSE